MNAETPCVGGFGVHTEPADEENRDRLQGRKRRSLLSGLAPSNLQAHKDSPSFRRSGKSNYSCACDTRQGLSKAGSMAGRRRKCS